MSRKITDKTDKLQVQNLTDINPEGTVRTPHKQDEEDTLSAQQNAQNLERGQWADRVLRRKSDGGKRDKGREEISKGTDRPISTGVSIKQKDVPANDGSSHQHMSMPSISPTLPCQGEIDREAMIKWCGIREQSRFSGIKNRDQKMSRIVAEDVREEAPKICSQEEREEWEERWYESEKQKKGLSEVDELHSWYEEGNIFSGSGRRVTATGGKQKKEHERKSENTEAGKEEYGKREEKIAGSNHVRQKLLRNYMINEMIHEPGKTDPNSHFELIGALIKNELMKPLYYVGIVLRKALLKLLGTIVALIIPLIPIILVVILLIYFITSPIAFFMGLFDDDDELAENPQNITNVVQEMYVEFYGGVDSFRNRDANNEVQYIYGNASNSREVMAVYLAKICLASDYRDMSMDGGYPAYLLVDTQREKEQLRAVFEQFNYTETEGITVSGTNEEGEEWEAEAEKMSVYCLSINQWKEENLSDLTDKEKNLLETLLEQVVDENAESGFIGNGTSIPISDLVIPDGVDENLVYMAGFVKAEAGNQSYEGKVAVAYVILNRAGGASGNIKGVLTAPYQFSCYIPYHTVERYLQEYASMTDAQRSQDSCWQAAAAAYNGTADNPIGSMRYYCNPVYCSAGETEQWRRIRARNSAEEIIQIGDHVFCQNCW